MSDEITLLTTEHITLQSARAACLQDMQGRASLFLTSVSGTLVAFGFLGAADHFGQGFRIFAITLLAALWILGIFTFLRLAQIGVEDTIIAFGIARIRHRYTELEPSLKDRFVRSIHDDIAGLRAEMGGGAGWWQALMPTQTLVSFVASCIAGAEVALIVNTGAHAALFVGVASGIVAAAINVLVFTRIAIRFWAVGPREFPARYPSP